MIVAVNNIVEILLCVSMKIQNEFEIISFVNIMFHKFRYQCAFDASIIEICDQLLHLQFILKLIIELEIPTMFSI